MIQKKICLVGDFAVGKTSLARRFVEGIFDDKYLSSIGANISRKVLALDGSDLTLLIWDLVGGEKFDRVIANYYRGSAGALLVCDLTRPETLDKLTGYASDFLGINPAAHLVFVGNKVDLTSERRIRDVSLAAVAERYHAPVFISSAKTGQDVQQAFETLGQHLLAGRVS